ncbi:MAG: hypothetical protein GY784_03930 [Gammaproteobacteria bacterium]|nr:hypothetical protein [Gammaproteobacteria bacterium]
MLWIVLVDGWNEGNSDNTVSHQNLAGQPQNTPDQDRNYCQRIVKFHVRYFAANCGLMQLLEFSWLGSTMMYQADHSCSTSS